MSTNRGFRLRSKLLVSARLGDGGTGFGQARQRRALAPSDRLVLLALASLGGSVLTGQVGATGSFVFDAVCSLGVRWLGRALDPTPGPAVGSQAYGG